jgi:PadR family transcriptional regulator PadR
VNRFVTAAYDDCRRDAIADLLPTEVDVALSDLGRIVAMGRIERVTEPTLDVLDVLLGAHACGREVHGWEIKKATGRSGPTVYGVIDRLEDSRLVEGNWERQSPDDKGPRRRYYRLTAVGVTTASQLLAERRGQSPRLIARAPGWRTIPSHGTAT